MRLDNCMATKKQIDIALKSVIQNLHDNGFDINTLIDNLGFKMNTNKSDSSNYGNAFDYICTVISEINPAVQSKPSHDIKPLTPEDF